MNAYSSSMRLMRKKRQNDRYHKKKDDDPLQDLHAAAHHLIRKFLIDTFESLEFTQDTGIPFGEMESLCGKPVNARQILISQELQDIIDALE